MIDDSDRDSQNPVSTNIVADEAGGKADNSHRSTTDNKTNVPINTGGYGNVADWNDATAKNSSDESAAN